MGDFVTVCWVSPRDRVASERPVERLLTIGYNTKTPVENVGKPQ